MAGSGLAAHLTGVENLRATAGESLPKRFPKIRSYGLLSPTATSRRKRARQLLALDPAPRPPCRI